MSYTLVNVRKETHKAIRELAALLDLSMQDTTKLAVMLLASSPEVRAIIAKRYPQPGELPATEVSNDNK